MSEGFFQEVFLEGEKVWQQLQPQKRLLLEIYLLDQPTPLIVLMSLLFTDHHKTVNFLCVNQPFFFSFQFSRNFISIRIASDGVHNLVISSMDYIPLGDIWDNYFNGCLHFQSN